MAKSLGEIFSVLNKFFSQTDAGEIPFSEEISKDEAMSRNEAGQSLVVVGIKPWETPNGSGYDVGAIWRDDGEKFEADETWRGDFSPNVSTLFGAGPCKVKYRFFVPEGTTHIAAIKRHEWAQKFLNKPDNIRDEEEFLG